jgi:hypothetical protein
VNFSYSGPYNGTVPRLYLFNRRLLLIAHILDSSPHSPLIQTENEVVSYVLMIHLHGVNSPTYCLYYASVHGTVAHKSYRLAVHMLCLLFLVEYIYTVFTKDIPPLERIYILVITNCWYCPRCSYNLSFFQKS